MYEQCCYSSKQWFLSLHSKFMWFYCSCAEKKKKLKLKCAKRTIQMGTKFGFGSGCCVCLYHFSLFSFLFFVTHAFRRTNGYCSWTVAIYSWLFSLFYQSCDLWTVHKTHKLHFLVTFLLKMSLTVLFTYLKIILLQYFQFSVFNFSKINSIQRDPKSQNCLSNFHFSMPTWLAQKPKKALQTKVNEIKGPLQRVIVHGTTWWSEVCSFFLNFF